MQHEAAWRLPPQGDAEGPQNLHLLHSIASQRPTYTPPSLSHSWHTSGRPGEFHPGAPTERSVTVSRHSALLILSTGTRASRPSGRRARVPSVPTCSLVSSQDNAWLLAQNKSQMSRPLRSASITEASALLRAGPPACPHRYSTPHSFCCSTHSLSPPTTLSGSRSPYRHTPSHVPCSSRRPDSRHLHTGHRLAGKRISRQTYPEVIHTPRF